MSPVHANCNRHIGTIIGSVFAQTERLTERRTCIGVDGRVDDDRFRRVVGAPILN